MVREYFSNVYMKIAVFPVGIKSERTYYFVIKKNRTLVVSIGSRWTDNVNSLVFMKEVEESKEIKLTKEEFQEIAELLIAVKKKPSKLGWWERTTTNGPPGMISLRYDFKSYSDYYGNDEIPGLAMLIVRLLEMSDIDDIEARFGNY